MRNSRRYKLEKAKVKRNKKVLLIMIGFITIAISTFFHFAKYGETNLNIFSDPIDKSITINKSEDNNLTLTKSVKKVQGSDDYEITLKTEGKAPQSTKQVDIVIVIDKSGSMQDKLSIVKRAVTSFLTNIENQNVNLQIGLATYNKTENSEGFINVKVAKGKIEELQVGGGTNTEGGMRAANTLLQESITKRPNAMRYIVFFTDGLPTYYYEKTQNSTIQIGGNGSDSTDKCFSYAKSEYDNLINNVISKTGKTIPFYTVGVFSGQFDERAQKFLFSIQNMATTQSIYNSNYYTNNTDKVDKIFASISNEIVTDINKIIAKNSVIEDTVANEFLIPSIDQLIVEGIDKSKVTINNNTISFNIGDIYESGSEIKFRIKPVDPYYGCKDVETNISANIRYNKPLDNSIVKGQYLTPKVDLTPVEGKIIINKVFSEDKGNNSDSFSIYLEGIENSSEKYGFNIYSYKEEEMNFYMKNRQTKIYNLNDTAKNMATQSKGYLTIGKYRVKEIVPMNYENVGISVKYGVNDPYIKLGDNDYITIDKDHSNIYVLINNKQINNTYWWDNEYVPNSITYSIK